jgi:hypothetical protein
VANIYRRYYDLSTEPFADIYPDALKAVLPTPASLAGKREGDLIVFARLALFEFGPEDDCDPEVGRHWNDIPNTQHFIVAGELDGDKGYRTRAIEVRRDFHTDSAGNIFKLSRVAYLYDTYAELRGRTIPFFRDVGWQPRTIDIVRRALTDAGFAVEDDES